MKSPAVHHSFQLSFQLLQQALSTVLAKETANIHFALLPVIIYSAICGAPPHVRAQAVCDAGCTWWTASSSHSSSEVAGVFSLKGMSALTSSLAAYFLAKRISAAADNGLRRLAGAMQNQKRSCTAANIS